jgi:tight adherence protein C
MTFLVALVVAAAVFVFVLSLGGGETRVRSRLAALRGSDGGERSRQSLTFRQRMVQPFTAGLGESLARLLPSGIMARMEERLVVAGEPMTASTFMALRFVCFVLFLGLPLMMLAGGLMKMSMTGIVLTGGFAFVGLMLPPMWLHQRVSQRQNQIIKTLPDAFDLITTCVEAGLGLDAALAHVADKVEGAFADELTRALREIGLGKQRRDALRELGLRTGVPDLVSFVNAVIQAEQMGSSVGAVLRVQAAQLRMRRRQRAEEQAYKAPVKMIFPLVLFIFPTLFIVILGPAMITIMKDFPAGK